MNKNRNKNINKTIINKFRNKIPKVVGFVICVPLIGTIFIKPDKSSWKQEKIAESAMDERFLVQVDEDIGSFYYSPEKLTELIMYKTVPEDFVFSASEDFIAGTDTAHDPEQEYLKALSIICRSNIVCAWEAQQRPEILAYDRLQLEQVYFYRIYTDILYDEEKKNRLNEIKRAADATKGAVITKDNSVATAPFFTTPPSDMLVSEPGGGAGFSLNYSYELARQGMDFYGILKYFFDDIKVNIYE